MTAIQAIAGLVTLYLGGGWLVRGASELATRLGVSLLAVGLTVVALGTSAPELVVSLDAALSGAPDISVGNVVGSNIANLGLILGLTALVRPARIKARMVRVDAPLGIVVALALVAVLADGEASRPEGFLLLLGLAAYTFFTLKEAKRESADSKAEFQSRAPQDRPLLALSLLRIAGGLVFLVAGGHLLVTSAVAMATYFGLSEAVIGLTIVAVGTSLPELATSLVASLRGEGDIAVGNVLGSNIFNVLGILGATALVRPLGLGGITSMDVGVMVALALLTAVLLTTRLRLERLEGLVMLAGYVLYTGWLLAS